MAKIKHHTQDDILLFQGNTGLDFHIATFATISKEEGYHNISHIQNTLHRFNFDFLIVVTQGQCCHLVDFEKIFLQAGDILLVKAMQVHYFIDKENWDGYLLGCRSQRQSESLDLGKKINELPNHCRLESSTFSQVCHYCDVLREHFHRRHESPVMQNFLNANLTALLSWLIIHMSKNLPDNPNHQRWQHFNALLAQHIHQEHQVAFYAAALHCTEKTLNLTCKAQTGNSTKIIINERIILESKRLLAHTTQPINRIGYQLGFAEPTHFVKFFKKQVGITPKAFRLHWQA